MWFLQVASMMLDYYDTLYKKWASQSRSSKRIEVDCPWLRGSPVRMKRGKLAKRIQIIPGDVFHVFCPVFNHFFPSFFQGTTHEAPCLISFSFQNLMRFAISKVRRLTPQEMPILLCKQFSDSLTQAVQ